MSATIPTAASLRLALVSYHCLNVTAEGLQAAKIARALADRGHDVTIFTSCHNWLEGDRVIPIEGPLEGLTVHRIDSDPRLVPRLWRLVGRVESRLGRLAALPNLLYGCAREEWSWSAAVARRVLQVAQDDGPFDILHTRLNPPASHLAGLMITRAARLPWCAYFSDPWPFHHYPPPYRSTIGPLSRRRLDRRLDTILRRAGSYVFPSSHQRDHQLAGARRRFRTRAVVAPHIGNVGQPTDDKPRGRRLRILHAGFLMRERRIEPLVSALRRLLAERPEARDVLRVEFVGRYADNVVPASPDGLETVVRFHRFERSDEVWQRMQAADVLLLVEADMKHGIFFPSKLADYLSAERPVLALSPDRGVARDLIDLGNGVQAAPADSDAIARALGTLVDAWQADRLDALRPNDEQRAWVAPSHVGACYEQAFARAREEHAA